MVDKSHELSTTTITESDIEFHWKIEEVTPKITLNVQTLEKYELLKQKILQNQKDAQEYRSDRVQKALDINESAQSKIDNLLSSLGNRYDLSSLYEVERYLLHLAENQRTQEDIKLQSQHKKLVDAIQPILDQDKGLFSQFNISIITYALNVVSALAQKGILQKYEPEIFPCVESAIEPKQIEQMIELEDDIATTDFEKLQNLLKESLKE